MDEAAQLMASCLIMPHQCAAFNYPGLPVVFYCDAVCMCDHMERSLNTYMQNTCVKKNTNEANRTCKEMTYVVAH